MIHLYVLIEIVYACTHTVHDVSVLSYILSLFYLMYFGDDDYLWDFCFYSLLTVTTDCLSSFVLFSRFLRFILCCALVFSSLFLRSRTGPDSCTVSPLRNPPPKHTYTYAQHTQKFFHSPHHIQFSELSSVINSIHSLLLWYAVNIIELHILIAVFVCFLYPFCIHLPNGDFIHLNESQSARVLTQRISRYS